MTCQYRRALGLACLLLSTPAARAADVFAHYMVGTVDGSTDHAKQDINGAIDMGFKAFALNVGQPGQDWAQDAVQQLFDAAAGTDFKLFFSLDLLQTGSLDDFAQIVTKHVSSDSYYRAGPDNKPFISSYSAGATSPQQWTDWVSTNLPDGAYLVPNLDTAQGYYTDIDAFLSSWGGAVDGLFSWETAWPEASGTASNVSTEQDEYVMAAAQAQSKAYMIPVSPLQYKHLPSDGVTYYRVGETNLPERMTQVLALDPRPQFAEVLTWNDAGESHYVSDNLWKEGLPDDIIAYANRDEWPHSGWGALLRSFNDAWAAGKKADAMTPPGTDNAAGSMWYRAILRDAACAGDQLGKPKGWEAASDAVNWAVVLKGGLDGWSVRVSSGGNEIFKGALHAGLNYGSVPGMRVGAQKLEVLGSDGQVVSVADGVKEVTADTDGICNFNYQVAGLKAGDAAAEAATEGADDPTADTAPRCRRGQ